MSGPRYHNDGGLEYRVRELERMLRRQEEIISQMERSRQAQFLFTESDRIVLGKSIYGPIAKGTAGQFQVFEGLFPSEAGAEPLTGINRFGYIGYDKWLIAVWVERCQGWYIVAAEC